MCDAGLKCVAGRCLEVPCGDEGQPCCDTDPYCGEDLTCLGGRCFPTPCHFPEGYVPYIPEGPKLCPTPPSPPPMPIYPPPIYPPPG